MASRKLTVEIVGDASSLEKAFGKAEKKAGGFGSAMGRVGKVAALTAGGAAIGGLIVTLKRGADEFSEGQKVGAQTAAVIKSTGAAAKVTEAQVGKLATTISNYSGIDDEAIQAGENMLLTFTNIRNEAGKGNKIFDQATKILTDMSVATGTDMSKSAIQLGKALNDPIKGVGALSRVGVTFTEKQKKTIATLVKTGKTAEAQKIILAELRKEFGGSAKAAGATFAGSLHKLGNSFDNLAGLVVGAAAPALQKYVDKLNAWLSKAGNQERVQKAVKRGIEGITGAIKAVKGAFDKVWPILDNIVGRMGGWKTVLGGIVALKVASKISGMASAIGDFGPKMGTAATNTGRFSKNLRGLNNIGAITIPIALAASMKGDSTAMKFLKAIGIGLSVAAITGSLSVGAGGAIAAALYFTVLSRPDELGAPPGTQGALDSPTARGPRRGTRPTGPTTPSRGRGAPGTGGPTSGFMSGRYSSMRLPAFALSPALAGAGAAGIHISGPITIVSNDPDDFHKKLQKKARRYSGSRSGPYGGHRNGIG